MRIKGKHMARHMYMSDIHIIMVRSFRMVGILLSGDEMIITLFAYYVNRLFKIFCKKICLAMECAF